MSPTPLDPTTLAVLWGGFQDSARLMGSVLRRTAYSIAVREGDDFSTAVFDAQGRLVAQGDFSPGHLGAMPFVVRHVAGLFDPADLRDGDGIVINDPYAGSGHLPDVFLVCPVLYEGRLVAWVANGTHHSDMGGYGVGSQAAEGVTDLHQEGLTIPALKLFRGGVENSEILQLILRNVRTPDKVRGDLVAQLNANRAGSRRLLGLFDRHGCAPVTAAMTEVMRRSEVALREGLAAVPDGRYTFSGTLDDCGRDTPAIRAVVAVTIAGDTVEVDFTGSDPQVEGAINCALNYTWAYTLCAVRALLAPHVPQNDGCSRPITLKAEPGSYFNPRYPAAVGGRQVASVRIFELIVGALAPIVPARALASFGDMCNPIISGLDPAGDRFVCYDLVIGGTGAGSGREGAQAVVGPHNPRNIPVEVLEATSPVRVERFGFVPDTGGAGEHRGASAVRKDIRVFGSRLKLHNLAERHTYPGFGLDGGAPGATGRITRLGAEPEALASKGSYRLADGDLVAFQTPGAGGYGDPLRRDPAAVLSDVRAGHLTRAGAEREHRVVLTGEPLAVDEAATARLRGAVPPRPAAGEQEVPA